MLVADTVTGVDLWRKERNVEATLEPRLVIRGNEGEPFISGDFLVAAYQRGYRPAYRDGE